MISVDSVISILKRRGNQSILKIRDITALIFAYKGKFCDKNQRHRSLRRNDFNRLPLFKNYFFLTRELSLINTCCWRADHEILVQDAIIFVSTRKNVLISDHLLVRKKYFDSNIVRNENVRILRRFSKDYFEARFTCDVIKAQNVNTY